MDWFASQLLDWHARHGRHDLPWQQNITPYRVWVSEVMLQQTQVATVIDYFQRFMSRFPDVDTLASAPLDEVLHLWTGLGYYARARNLHKAANVVVDDYGSEFPLDQAGLESLPGIGRSTAGAIRAIAMSQHAAILDGNVKRVLARFHAVPGYPGVSAVASELWRHAERHTPAENTATYTQAIMDLGATVCVRRRPPCDLCPLSERCAARASGDTEQYPGRKPKKDKPVREARFFVVSLEGGATYLERRPTDGLWGGLWTPPERAATTTTQALLAELGAELGDVLREDEAPAFRHTFTHFHLDIRPTYIWLSRCPQRVEDDQHARWITPSAWRGENDRIGLSVPAVKLLAPLGLATGTRKQEEIA